MLRAGWSRRDWGRPWVLQRLLFCLLCSTPTLTPGETAPPPGGICKMGITVAVMGSPSQHRWSTQNSAPLSGASVLAPEKRAWKPSPLQGCSKD